MKSVHEVVVGIDRHPPQIAEAVPVGRANDDCVSLIHLPDRVDHPLLDRIPSLISNAVRLVEHLVVELGWMIRKVSSKLSPHWHQHIANIRRSIHRRIKRVVVQNQMQPQLVGPIRDLVEKGVEQGIDAVIRRTTRHGVQINRQTHHVAAELLDLLKIGPAKLGKVHVLRTGRLQPIAQVDAPAKRSLSTPRGNGPYQQEPQTICF